MHISMAPWKRRSICSSLKDLRWADQIMSADSGSRSMASSKLAVTTRPDIAYAASVLARFNSNPGPYHWMAAKHVLRYLKGTMDYRIAYQPSASPEPFITYSDADHGGNPDNGKSTGGYVVKIGSGAVSWSSKLQPLVALSTTEAEHILAVEAGKEILWMCQFMGELGYDVSGPSLLRMDNQSAIAVSKNLEDHRNIE